MMSSESKNSENSQEATGESQEHIGNKQIGIRLLYTILFLFILGILMIIVKLVVMFQFIYFFSTRKLNEPVRQFSNKICAYGYRVFRYITLNENKRPFPFSDLPPEMEPSDKKIGFN